MDKRRWLTSVVCLSIGIINALGQQPVDPRNMYERCWVVVPLIGKGTWDDPKRPMYVPLPGTLRAAAIARSGGSAILGFTHQMSDDGQHALVEFVARDRAAFQAILADPSVKAFLKGRDKKEDVEAEFKKYKKNFDITTFGVRVQ